MSQRLLMSDAEIATPEDFDNMTRFSQEAMDSLVGDAIAYPENWAGFTVSAAANAQVVTISAGRYFQNKTVYEAADTQQLNLQLYLPTIASDEKWVALILRGRNETEYATRAFKDLSADADDNSIVMQSTPKVDRRVLSIVVQQGFASPAPALVPIVSDTDCCIAMVRLKSSGVQEIISYESDRVKSLFEIEGRVTALEVNLSSLFLRTKTLETDLAIAFGEINEIKNSMTRPEIIRQMRRDVAALRIEGNTPAGTRTDWYDPGLLMTQWDNTYAQWLARVDEGIHFPYAAEKQARLSLVAEDDPRIRFRGRKMMPVWDEVVRLQHLSGGASRDISQAVHTNVIATKREVARSSIEYGPTLHICENAQEWARYTQSLHVGATFTRNGEVFEIVADETDGHHARNGVRQFAVRTVKKHDWIDVYWDYRTEKIGVNGSIFGQTFLISQPTIATAVNLFFTRVGGDGDVHLFLAETDATGAPVMDRVLARTTKTRAQLVLGRNSFPVEPVYLTPGRRYAWFTVTTGNHALGGSEDNAFTGGTSFRVTDGAWAQGDLNFDFQFELVAAGFRNSRTVLAFQNLDLQNGMTEIRLLYASWALEGTAIEWEIRPSGTVDWVKFDPQFAPLNGLPAMVELRATLLSTPDLAPMIVLDENAITRTARPRAEMRAVSKAIDLGITTTTIQTLTVLDDFDPAVHVFTPRITVGAASQALVVPSVTTTKIDRDKPQRREVLSTYTVPAGTQIVRNAPGLTTNNVVNTTFIENTALFAL